METLGLALVALIVGFFCGCTSIGGILLIPGIVLLSTLDIHQAMGTALFSFAIMALLGTVLHGRKGTLELRPCVALCLGAFISAYFGGLVNSAVSEGLLNMVLAVLVLFAGVSALRSGDRPIADTRSLPENRRLALLFALGLFVGFMSGLTGIGGPVLSVPFMIAMGYAPLMSVATAQPLQLVAGISGSVAYVAGGAVDYTVAALVTVLELVGFYAGLSLAYRMRGSTLKVAVALLCLGTGIYLLFR